MIRQLLQILLVFSFILLLFRCAQVVPLTGGKKDTTPPRLMEAQPVNAVTDFNAGEIVLKFDEFVQIKDLANQLIVSPSLKTAPEITVDGKKIRILLKKEELAPNTTYRFHFGQAIADMNESNAIPGFDYVFSTGSFIDSLEIKGSIAEALNNKPSAGVQVSLYHQDRAGDSLPYTREPDYIARSDEKGEFAFRNLPYRTFKVYAFLDKNKNNLYDGETEKVSFLGEELNLVRDTSIRLRLFQEEASKSFVTKTSSPYYGLVQIFLNRKSKTKVSALRSKDARHIFQTDPEKDKDTVSVYYKTITDSLQLALHNVTADRTDTLKFAIPRNNPAKKRLKSYTLNTSGNTLALNDKIRLAFLTWMDTSRHDLSKIRLSSKEDSLVSSASLKGRWRSITSFEIDHTFKEGLNYTLRIDTGAFFGIDGIANDSSTFNFRAQSKAEFGKLTLKIMLNKKQSYLVQLVNEQEQVIREQAIAFSLSSSNAASIDFTDIPPGTYLAKIIFDDNKNKKWDSGHLIRKQQPEKVIIHPKQLKVLSDWEIEEEILIKE